MSKDRKIIDMHAHIFPHKIAEKATKSIGAFYNIPMSLDGTLETLFRHAASIGTDRILVHSTATVPSQVQAINNFVSQTVAEYSDRLIGFGTLHMDYAQSLEEMDRMIALGLKGIKLHPDFQRFDIDDPRMYPIYDAASGRLPILFHAGDPRYDYSRPSRLAKVAREFPNLKVIAAHLGGYCRWDEIEVYRGLKNVYYDSSSALFKFTPEQAKQIILQLGIDRVMFGTDYPMWTHEQEFKNIQQLGLTPSEQDLLFYQNAERLLNIHI